MYNEYVMEIFKNPKNVGMIHGANGIGQVGNAKCGDIMKIYLRIEDGKIADASFKTFGCVAAIVSTSIATELIKGKTLEEARKLKNSEILKMMGPVPTNKIHCSVLAEEAINAAIDDYEEKLLKEQVKELKDNGKEVPEELTLKLKEYKERKMKYV